MKLDSTNAEAISQIVADEGWGRVATLRFSSATLAGIVELGRTAFFGGENARVVAAECISQIRSATDLVQLVFNILNGAFCVERQAGHLFSAPEIELWMVRSPVCIESSDFSLFVNRFKRTLVQSRFGEALSYSLSQALIEMSENVVRHSSPVGCVPACGIVGYHVVPDEMNYIVADLGRGVLNSLRENRRWSSLTTESDALLAIAKRGATRLAQHPEGDGFRLAIKAFVDRQGILAMRSGDGIARICGNMDRHKAEVSNAQHVPGFRVTALCGLRESSKEITIQT